MGQKINPNGVRLGIVRDWNARWYAEGKHFRETLCADIAVRDFIEKELAAAGISRVLIERPAKNAKITIFAGRPGVIIGRKGDEIEALRNKCKDILKVPVHIAIEEVKRHELDARLVAQGLPNSLKIV